MPLSVVRKDNTMDVNSRLALSYYKDIAEINSEHHVSLVQHIENNKIYVKKVLYQYNKDIYLSLLNHPVAGLPRLYEVIEADDELIIIEEYISGETLQEMIDCNKRIPIYEACEYILQICDCLSNLHNLNPPIIHRDIKPSNIMITPSSHVILLDLNAAKYVNNEKDVDTTLLGTKGYAAPEQYGFGSSNEKTDIYALGILINTIINDLAIKDIDLSDTINPIIEKCTYIDPSKRYDSVIDVKAHLLQIPFLSIPKKTTPVAAKNWKTYLPPGFRTGNFLHILLGICGYSFITWMCATLEVKNSTPFSLIIERISCFLVFISIVLVSGNYMDIHKYLPICKSKNTFIKILGIILYDIIVMFVILIFMCLVLSIFV